MNEREFLKHLAHFKGIIERNRTRRSSSFALIGRSPFPRGIGGRNLPRYLKGAADDAFQDDFNGSILAYINIGGIEHRGLPPHYAFQVVGHFEHETVKANRAGLLSQIGKQWSSVGLNNQKVGVLPEADDPMVPGADLEEHEATGVKKPSVFTTAYASVEGRGMCVWNQSFRIEVPLPIPPVLRIDILASRKAAGGRKSLFSNGKRKKKVHRKSHKEIAGGLAVNRANSGLGSSEAEDAEEEKLWSFRVATVRIQLDELLSQPTWSSEVRLLPLHLCKPQRSEMIALTPPISEREDVVTPMPAQSEVKKVVSPSSARSEFIRRSSSFSFSRKVLTLPPKRPNTIQETVAMAMPKEMVVGVSFLQEAKVGVQCCFC